MQIDRTDPAFNTMQNVKRHMFAMRNGVVADALRRSGDPHRFIFGLTLPDLSQIAKVYAPDNALANSLWQNETTRESRLLAPMLYDLEYVTYPKAVSMIASILCTEEVDILCHRLLRHLDFAPLLITQFANDRSDLKRYLALRLAYNTMMTNHQQALEVSTNEFKRNCTLTSKVARQLIADINDIFGND